MTHVMLTGQVEPCNTLNNHDISRYALPQSMIYTTLPEMGVPGRAAPEGGVRPGWES